MDKIKIVWLAPFPLDQINGLTLSKVVKGNGTWLLNLASELRKRGDIDFHIITYSAKIGEDVQVFDDGITFHILKYQIPIVKKGFPYFFRIDVLIWYFPLVKRMHRLLDNLNPDIVHAHGTESCYALAANRYKKCPSIISIQGIINEYVKISPTVYFRLQKRIERNTIINGVNFGCRTDWDKSFVSSINKSANIIYLPEAIGACFFEEQWKGAGLNTLTFVGSIIERKGILDLIRACTNVKSKYPNFILNLIGTGPSDYVAQVKALVTEIGLTNNVIWHGSRSSEQIAEILKSTTVYVLPTYSDNSPNSLCEAMAVGVPSVAYSTGGVPSLIKHNVDGFLVNAGEINTLGETICRIMGDSALQIRISISAKKVGVARNNPVSVCETYMHCYNSLIYKL
jgi:Glycosyltransferase